MTADTTDAGQRYGDYEVESLLGKGAIGKVYLARHLRIGRRVALKTIRLIDEFDDDSDQIDFFKRLQREAELCGALQHPNVVTLYEVGYQDDRVSYLAIEYIDGESLQGRLKRTRPLPLSDAIAIACDVLRGLAYAHSKSIIHRDVKPANILLTKDGHAKIADFGIARPAESSLTGRSSLLGTPNYMSPEQVKSGPVSPRSDLFSVGVVLYEMVTGIKPFAATSLSAILMNVIQHQPAPAHTVSPAVSEALARVIAKLMAKNPDDRYPSAHEALRELEAARDGTTLAPIDYETFATPEPDATNPLPTFHDLEPFEAGHAQPQSLNLPLDEDTERDRRMPPAVGWGITLLLAAALATWVGVLRSRMASTEPVGVITLEQVDRDTAKRRALAEARAFAEAGKYQEALARYDALLQRFPENTVARTERDEVQRAWAEHMPRATMSVSRPRTPRAPEPPPKPSRWERFKHWFKGGK